MKLSKKIIWSLFCVCLLAAVIIPFQSTQIQPSSNYTDNQKENITVPSAKAQTKDRVKPITDANSNLVPIVLYHHIRPITPSMDKLAKALSVTPEVFDAQLTYFAQHGFSPITLFELTRALEKKGSLPKKPLILTFDDGYEDAYTHAYPLLQKHHFNGSLFIFTQGIGASDYLTWKQVEEMQQSGVFEIGSHTLSHADLPKISRQHMIQEISKSKKIIEAKLGAVVDFFCYPYGHYTKEILDEVSRAGYRGAVTTLYGIDHPKSSVFELTRVRLNNDDHGERLDKKMSLILRH